MKNKFSDALLITYNNAVQLYEDATLLEKNNRLARAFTLYHISFEEAGRFSLIIKNLFKYFLGEIKANELNYGNLKKQGYENHIKKLNESLLYMFKLPIFNTVVNEKGEPDALLKIYEQFSEDIPKLNKLKNDSLYITFENNSFKSPSDLIDEDSIFKAKIFAEIQIDTMKKFLNWIKEKGGINEIENELKKHKK